VVTNARTEGGIVLDIAAKAVTVAIYYDGDCPFCSEYVRYLRLHESVGAPELVNLRDVPEARAQLEAEGFDLDRGMVADIAGVRYGGADALNALALLTTPSGLFNRATAALFSLPALSRIVYPVMRAGRNATLTLLGRTPLRADEAGWEALFQVFTLVFGLFAVMHFFINAFDYTAFEVFPSSWIVLVCGAGLLLRPGSKRIFVVLIAAMVVDAWLRAPMQSNHTNIKNFLLVAFLGSAAWHALKGSRWSDFFRDAAPVGRVLLLSMYFYGVFHKINEGFLDPSVSCAVVLWKVMPWPIHLLDHPVIHHLTIYGTFVVETVIVVMLLVQRWRHWGIMLGVGFHGLIALSGFAMYPAFSTLTIALHTLFLSPEQARRIVKGENYQGLIAGLRSWKGAVLLPAVMLLVAAFAIRRDLNMVAFSWLSLAALVVGVILYPGKSVSEEPAGPARPDGSLLWSRLAWLNAVGVLFFLSCALPYLGLKTAQTVNMFANLRLEGGVNNHLIMRALPMPFGYLDDLVEIREASGDRILEQAARAKLGMVYYHLLHRLNGASEARVSFVRKGTLYSNQSAASLADDIMQTLHPKWFRKWFHFQWVPLANPPPC
jgi:predicted DCC family thiol-disulfide oxidoreductase YuxK